METTGYIYNEKYVTTKGDPVVFQGKSKDGKMMIVKSIASGNELRVPLSYKLLPYAAEKVNSAATALMINKAKSKNGIVKPKLSHKIDEFFRKGHSTIAQIAEQLKDAPETIGKNLKANIHARLVSYKRRGDRVVKKGNGLYEVAFKAKNALV